MLNIGKCNKSIGAYFPITVTWDPSDGSSVEECDIAVTGAELVTEAPRQHVTASNVTTFWIDMATSQLDTPVVCKLTPTTDTGIIDPGEIRIAPR